MKLVSFLMPTRTATYKVLRNAVYSIINTAASDDFEILLRIDDDDKERWPVARDLVAGYGKVVIGPRGCGYMDMGMFVNDLLRVADSQWCWLFDDDAWVEGDWYTPLCRMPCDPEKGPAVNPDFYVLGPSYYQNGENPPGMLMPTEFCRKLNHVAPVDQQWMDEVHRLRWRVEHLVGVNYHHDGRPR